MATGVRTAVVGMCVIGCGVLLGRSSADADQPARDSGRAARLHFDVAFSPFSYTDLGPAGPGAPDAIVFALVNSPPPRKELAITGGSGRYRAARGDGTLVEAGSATGTLDLRLVRR
jgi:hypothetical protein